MDGREIHFSTSRAQTFQYSWSSRGNHVIKVVAHATAPILGEPYELFIDGQPFSSMPKSYGKSFNFSLTFKELGPWANVCGWPLIAQNWEFEDIIPPMPGCRDLVDMETMVGHQQDAKYEAQRVGQRKKQIYKKQSARPCRNRDSSWPIKHRLRLSRVLHPKLPT